MKRPYICAVIGKNFGDEGKGLAVDYLSMQSREGKVLVIRHNGGAQSGHTVDLPGKRFVFHELSAGSFRGADTFWTDTYYPDFYKLGEEAEAFHKVSGFVPRIFVQPNTQITLIDDVLVNMAAEEARGALRHGSCGMGIYEAQLRGETGFAVTVDALFRMNEADLIKRLQEIREAYLPKRLQELELTGERLGEYGDLLESKTVLENTAVEILRNLKYVQVIEDTSELLKNYDRIVFENGQGLLLDGESKRFAPHVTASRTGLHNPCAFLQRYNLELDEVLYVTRSYVTRHGAGELPYECKAEALGVMEQDLTNVENPWQGSLRYARHGSEEEFVNPVVVDLQVCSEYRRKLPCRGLLISHLNETNGCICMEEGSRPVREFCDLSFVRQTFDKFYLSSSVYAAEVQSIQSCGDKYCK